MGVDAGSKPPVSQLRKGANERTQAYQEADMNFGLTHSPARADANERKRSALAGVQVCEAAAKVAEQRSLEARLRLRDAIAAARDEGIPVREIAQFCGMSRQAIYKRMERLRDAETKH